MRSHYSVTTLDLAHRHEVSESARRNGVRVLSCDLDQQPIPSADAAFDVVIMNEVFEHLRINLIHSMREVARVLKPGGMLLLSTPNLRSFRGLYNLVVRGEAYAVCRGIYENYALLESDQVMGHVREYTSREVKELLERIGFVVDGIIYRGRYNGSALWNAAQAMTRMMPQFKPFFSMVANRPPLDATAASTPAHT
jgi:SAM-dependent methyltransferase